MADSPTLTALGLMSGTSMDGIDAAIVRTDGAHVATPVAARSRPYEVGLRTQLRGVLGGKGPVEDVSVALTHVHAALVVDLLAEAGMVAADIDVIGFHGHTILHAPQEGRTWQIGDGALLAALTGIDVVADFRSADVAAGGEGAPFAPIYHAAFAPGERPLCILNIGGVANLTWVGVDADPGQADIFEHLLAFDTGPGNALIDDWVASQTGDRYDADGRLAAVGTVDTVIVAELMAHPYFVRPAPKSLDREDFPRALAAVSGLSAADGAATLAAFTVAAVARAQGLLPDAPRRWLVTGGGRHNPVLMRMLGDALDAPVEPVEAAGLDGDLIEAQAFAYMAVRSLKDLPLSGPGTTGVAHPLTGGRRFAA